MGSMQTPQCLTRTPGPPATCSCASAAGGAPGNAERLCKPSSELSQAGDLKHRCVVGNPAAAALGVLKKRATNPPATRRSASARAGTVSCAFPALAPPPPTTKKHTCAHTLFSSAQTCAPAWLAKCRDSGFAAAGTGAAARPPPHPAAAGGSCGEGAAQRADHAAHHVRDRRGHRAVRRCGGRCVGRRRSAALQARSLAAPAEHGLERRAAVAGILPAPRPGLIVQDVRGPVREEGQPRARRSWPGERCFFCESVVCCLCGVCHCFRWPRLY